jgi:hypothetical protein
MPKLSVELSEQNHRQLKIKSAWAGLTQSDVVRHLLSAWFRDEVKIPEQDEPPTREKGDQSK